jgi:hypothetical protein
MDLTKTLKKTVQEIQDKAEDLIESLQPEDEPIGQKPTPVLRRVLMVIYNPTIRSESGRKLSAVMKWNNPDELTAKYITDLRECSYGYANFDVVERIEVDRFPVKDDGFLYDGDQFVKALRSNAGFHQPDLVDYHRILADFNIIEKINSGAIDEVWLYAFPYAGFYESIMAGPGAFWCNAPPLTDTDRAKKRFVIMGFNYQRGVGEMIENMGHRAESIMTHVFRNKKGDENLWERFTRYDKTHPGQAEVGIVHYAPNSLKDYDWGNRARVRSRCDVWHNFPNLEGSAREMDCSEWGNGDTREHHLWWFRHFPHITGSSGGIAYNWWKYVIDPNTVR